MIYFGSKSLLSRESEANPIFLKKMSCRLTSCAVMHTSLCSGKISAPSHNVFMRPANSFSRICNLSATTLGSSKSQASVCRRQKSRKDFACNSSKGQRPNARRVACAHAQQFFCLLRVFVFGMQRELFPCKFIALFVKQYIACRRKIYALHLV